MPIRGGHVTTTVVVRLVLRLRRRRLGVSERAQRGSWDGRAVPYIRDFLRPTRFPARARALTRENRNWYAFSRKIATRARTPRLDTPPGDGGAFNGRLIGKCRAADYILFPPEPPNYIKKKLQCIIHYNI